MGGPPVRGTIIDFSLIFPNKRGIAHILHQSLPRQATWDVGSGAHTAACSRELEVGWRVRRQRHGERVLTVPAQVTPGGTEIPLEQLQNKMVNMVGIGAGCGRISFSTRGQLRFAGRWCAT